MSSDDRVAAALAFAARGWPVFPCQGKRPRTRRGLHDATTDRERIERHWRAHPSSNIAVRTGEPSGLVVLDVDGQDGADALAELEREHGDLPVTIEAFTGGGGRHLVFAHPGGGEVRSSASQLGPGLDVRGDGGYIIAPPSVHENGRLYTWSVDGHPDDVEPAELPAWLLDAVRMPERRDTSPTAATAEEDTIPEGKRDATLASHAGRMRRGGMAAEEIEAALAVINDRRCRPPLDGRDVHRIARSIARYKPAQQPATSATRDAPKVTCDAKGKLVLPPVPAVDDIAGLCAWLTVVFALDPAHPVTGGERQGIAGPEGHAELRRASAPAIRLEPLKVVNTPARLTEAVNGWALPSDGAMAALSTAHCRSIAHVVRMVCGASATITAEQETTAVIGAYQHAAEAIEGLTTYGTPGQRWEAADALRGDPAARAPRYLVDVNTGELVIRVSDLAEVARRHVGASLPHGWLDGRLSAIGWQRVTLDGHAIAGREGRAGPHARCAVYRGVLPAAEQPA